MTVGIIIGIAIGIPIGTYVYRKALLAYLHGEFERINRMLEEEKNEIERDTCRY